MKKSIQINITLIQKDRYTWQEAKKIGGGGIKYHAFDWDMRRKE